MSGSSPVISPLLLTRDEAAAAMKLCVRTLDGLIARGELAVIRLGESTVHRKGQAAFTRGARVLIPASELQRWIESRMARAGHPPQAGEPMKLTG